MNRAPRDKDYLRTADGMLFNITGDVHPPDAVYGSLKYVDGEKWTAGYDAAKRFLQRHFPQYVRDFICVPRAAVVEHYYPRERFQQLRASPTRDRLALAVELGELVADFLQIPPSDVGITDSLLWGAGHAESDIDLVVYGAHAAGRLLDLSSTLYQLPDFARPHPSRVRAPYGRRVREWPKLLDRKWHMGMYAGVPFSLRAVRDAASPPEPQGKLELELAEFEVKRVDESLYFPAVYQSPQDVLLIDYTVVYEGALRSGDRLRGRFAVGRSTRGQRVWVTDPRHLDDYQHQWSD